METGTSQRCGHCWITALGITFFVLAAACYFYAAYHTYRINLAARQMWTDRNFTPELIRSSVGAISGSRLHTDWSFPAGLGFTVLGFACLLPCRRCCCCQSRGSHEP